LTPGYLWFRHGKNSTYLEFQSAQATVYQILGNLLVVLGGPFGGMALISLVANYLPLGGLPLTVILACAGLMFPAYYILGLWAGLRILQGHAFRYPFLGNWVEKIISI
jgi:hypothetical protein